MCGISPQGPWGHSGAVPPTGTWCPQWKLQWKNWLTRASLSAIKVVIVNCNGTVVVVPFMQCQWTLHSINTKKTFEVLSLLRPTGLATALWTFSSDGRLEAELVNQSFMKFGIQQKIRTTVTVMWWNIKSWRTVVVGKYSKCHNSPANVPTGTQLWWSHPIMFPILEMLWLPIGTTLGWRVVAFKQHVCCKTVSLVLI